jgi:hypothetical protein
MPRIGEKEFRLLCLTKESAVGAEIPDYTAN